MDGEPQAVLAQGKVDLPQAVEPSGLGEFAAVLWVPDPEKRYGWREYYVRRPDGAKPGVRLGF